MSKPTKAILFDQVEKATSQIIYDRTDRSVIEAVLGGALLATPIVVDGLDRPDGSYSRTISWGTSSD